MRELLKSLLTEIIGKNFKIEQTLKIEILIPQEQYGDFSTNISFQIAKIIKKSPSTEGLKEIWASGTILDINSSGRFFRDY